MNFNNLKIGQRLGLGFGMVLLLLVVLAGVALSAMNAATRSQHELVDMKGRAAMADEWVASTQLNINRVLALAKSGANPQVDAYFKPLIAETTERINVLQKSLEEVVSSDEGKALLADIAERRKEYIAIRKAYFEALKGAEPGAEAQLNEKLLPAAQRYIGTMQELQRYEHSLVGVAMQQAEDTAARQRFLIGGIAAVALLVGLAVAWRITRSVLVPVASAVQAARAVAEGDLTQTLRVDRRDELGDLQKALADMKQSLLGTVTQVRQASDSIGVASAEIASGNQDLSARTEQAASNLEETAASMEQLTSTVRNSADAARQANQLAASASEVAVRGGQVVQQVVSTMQDIHHSSQKISDIIGTIDGIAFQTNILALNAAVEAARAGEQGRGFAVVAGEVRNLAQRSAEAAKEIKDLIGASVDKVDVGTKLVADAGATMGEIVGSIQRVTDIVGEISSAAGEQSDGIGQVNTAVSQLDQMTQQNAALVEQSAAAAQSLHDQAARLAQVVSTFRINGSSASEPAPATRPMQSKSPAKPAASKAVAAPVSKTGSVRPVSAPALSAPAPVAKPVAISASAESDWESF